MTTRENTPTVEQARNAFRSPLVGRVEDIQIDSHGRQLPLRLYLPAGPGPFAVLMYFHGGGWVAGDLDTHDGFCRLMRDWIACAVVAVDYARPPEHVFPAAVEDCLAAVDWAHAQSEQQGFDPHRIAVAGGGSGGGLTAVICQLARQRETPAILCQLLLYPVLDCLAQTPSYREFAEGYGLTAHMLEWYLNHYVPKDIPRDDPRLSPGLSKDLRGLPPTLIVTSGLDVLRDEGRAYAQRLQAADVTVEHLEFADMVHGFINSPSLHDDARQAQLWCVRKLQAQFMR